MVKEHPLIMSGLMVKSILKELKDMTRRTKGLESINDHPDDWDFYAIGKETIVKTGKDSIVAKFKHKEGGYYVSVKLPWWREDILWVRENLEQEGELGLLYQADRKWVNEELIPNDYGPYGGT